MKFAVRLILTLLTLWCDPSLRAQSNIWLDPDFDEAIRSSALICTGIVQSSQSNKVAVTVKKVFKGVEEEGNTIIVQQPRIIGSGGFQLPPEHEYLFVLKPKGTGYAAFTQSYWSFYVSDSTVFMPIRDPVSYIHMNREAFFHFLKLYMGSNNRRERDEFVAAWMKELAKTDPFTKSLNDVETQMFALETLCHLHSGADPLLLQRYLLSPYYQVRWSAIRALSVCNDVSTNDVILKHLDDEDAPHVLSVMGKVLFDRNITAAAETLRKRIPEVSKETIRLASDPDNPVFNTIPSARASLSAALMHFEKQSGSYDELVEKHVSFILHHPTLKVDYLEYARPYNSIEEAMGKPDSVFVLSLYGNNLSAVPGELARFRRLAALSLEKNSITRFPDFMKTLPLVRLELGYNGLTTIPAFIYSLATLQRLDLRSNELSGLDKRLFTLSGLKKLNLAENALKEIPVDIRTLHNLESLDASHNELTKFPAGIAENELLKTLDLGFNKIDSLPGSIGKLTYIEFLSLQGNNIRYIPDEIWELSKLRLLDLRGNPLTDEEIEKISILVPPRCRLLTGKLE